MSRNVQKRMRRLTLLVCSAALLACVGIGASFAYLTNQDTVTNSFTVGSVAITLDEAAVNADGTRIEGAERVQANEYHLIPGRSYTKDPTVHVGDTSRGTPVWFNSYAMACDKIIITCGVVYHFLAGFGGGGKMLLPGIAGYETIQRHHKQALNPGFGNGTNADVRSANMADTNIFHADIFEAAAMARPCFGLNVVVNDDYRIIKAFAGDWVQSHAAACRLVDSMEGVTIPERTPLVVASAGGYPKDINLYQTIKLLSNALSAVQPGGTMILLSRCSEGFGNPDVETQICAYSDMQAREKALRDTFSIVSYVGFLFAEAAEKHNLILVTDMDAALFGKTKMHVCHSLDEALDKARHFLGQELDVRTIIMPHGASTLPKLAV